MSGWDFGTTGNASQKAEFTKFPVGVTRIRIIDDMPYTRWTHWLPQHKRSINCPGKGCPICEIRKQQKANKEAYTHAMGRRVAINIYNLETEKVEIMEQGVTFFEDLKDVMSDVNEKGKTLKDAVIKVRRRGSGKDDTSYRLDLDEISELPVEDINNLRLKAIKLDEYFKPHEPEKILRILQGEKWEDVMKSEQNDDSPIGDADEEFQIR